MHLLENQVVQIQMQDVTDHQEHHLVQIHVQQEHTAQQEQNNVQVQEADIMHLAVILQEHIVQDKHSAKQDTIVMLV